MSGPVLCLLYHGAHMLESCRDPCNPEPHMFLKLGGDDVTPCFMYVRSSVINQLLFVLINDVFMSRSGSIQQGRGRLSPGPAVQFLNSTSSLLLSFPPPRDVWIDAVFQCIV